MPTKVLDMKCPYLILFSKQPTYDCINIFGCLCYPYLRMYNKDKFAKRTYPYVFIDYSPIHKGFRCLYPKTNRVYISRHVIFYEDVFPFNSLALTSGEENKSISITEFTDLEAWTVGESKEKETMPIEEAAQRSKKCNFMDCTAPSELISASNQNTQEEEHHSIAELMQSEDNIREHVIINQQENRFQIEERQTPIVGNKLTDTSTSHYSTNQ